MNTVYVVMVEDRHTDPEPFVFSTAEAAITFARREAHDLSHGDDQVEESDIGGWLYYATYSNEGDRVWVIEKTIDAIEIV